MATSKQPTEVSDTSSSTTKKSDVQNVSSPLTTFKNTHDILVMVYPKDKAGNFSESIQSEDEITVYELLKANSNKKNNLLLLLDTSGGSVYSAVKIMDCLRVYYQNITIAVPQEAKSSGTMMCFGADKLIMSPVSELGPLDKPLRHPDNETAYISALDIVRSLDDMMQKAFKSQVNVANGLRDSYGLRTKTCLEISTDLVSKLYSPMLQHEDVKIYNQAKRLLAIADKYGKEMLKKHMFSYIKGDKIKEQIVNYVVRQFVWLYPDHAFAVRRDELRDNFFIVEDAEKLDYWEEIWNEFKGCTSNIGKSIKYI